MDSIFSKVIANVIAAILLAIIFGVAKLLAKKVRETGGFGQTAPARLVYTGTYLDFFLTYARPMFYSVMAFVLLLNLLGLGLLRGAQGLLFLDTAGTALAAFTLGPWWAAAMAILTNLFGTIITGPDTHYHQFGIVNALLGIVWGYFAIWRRQDVTQLDLGKPGRFVLTAVALGAIGVLVSTPLSSYLLVFRLHVLDDPNVAQHTGDEFQMALFYAARPANLAGNGQDFVMFMICQVPSNLADKTISVFIALVLLHLLFPIIKVFDSFAPTMNFIKLSAGSHMAFALFYLGTYFPFNYDVGILVLLSPPVLCVMSYVGMAFFIPETLNQYHVLARHFGGSGLSMQDQSKRRRILRFGLVGMLLLAVYAGIVAIASSWIGMSAAQVRAELSGILSVTITVVLFLLAGANLFFVVQDFKKIEKKLLKQLGATEPPNANDTNSSITPEDTK